jgi:8-amino-7-oxononanoate synthase
MEIDAALRRVAGARVEKSLERRVRSLESVNGVKVSRDGGEFISFASNDYLGLSQHPRLKEAAIRATELFGAGAGASRLICGSLPVHRELDETIAQFKGTQGALSFSTGYAAALGAICSLVGSNDVVIVDKLVHASLVDGARLSGAKLRVFRHNDLADLESILEWADKWRDSHSTARILVVTESVFSMDGDCAPLREIVEMKNRFGAWLMLDEAHALGVLGQRRRGRSEELGVAKEIEVQMGTLGKAAGAAGGFIAGSNVLVDHLINSARSFIFSTAPTPATAAGARAGLEIIASAEGEDLKNRLIANVQKLGCSQSSIPIVPIILGDEPKALAASEQLLEAGFLVPAIRYPTVARGQARLRVTLSAAHSGEQIEALAAALRKIGA